MRLTKITFLLFIITTFICRDSYSQTPEVQTYLERTYVGSKLGTAVSYEFANRFSVGLFHQESIAVHDSEAARLHYEKSFSGILVDCPLKTGNVISCFARVRTGVTNMDENFAITPSVHMYVRPLQLIRFGLGVGIRAFRPTAMASLSLRLSS